MHRATKPLNETDERLIPDTRAEMSPSDMVENKLVVLLRAAESVRMPRLPSTLETAVTFGRKQNDRTVSRVGAAAGDVLCGVGLNNRGLRLRILQEQDRGHDGPLCGGFVILDAGDNKHSDGLAALLGRVTNAAEVLRLIRREHKGCVNVTNANVLSAETVAGRPPLGGRVG
jgi:hypothetical protein